MGFEQQHCLKKKSVKGLRTEIFSIFSSLSISDTTGGSLGRQEPALSTWSDSRGGAHIAAQKAFIKGVQ